MLLPKSPKTRQYKYTPFFYQPLDEEEGLDGERPRIKFRRPKTLADAPKRKSPVVLFVMMLIIFVMLFYLSRISKRDAQNQSHQFQVEEVIVK